MISILNFYHGQRVTCCMDLEVAASSNDYILL